MRAYLLVAVLLMAAAANASLANWDIEVSVNDDGSTDWTVVLTYNETVEKSDYFVFSKITNVEVFADKKPASCDITQDIGTSIVCRDAKAAEFTYKFHVKGLVDNVQNLKIFRYPLPVTATVDKLGIVVKFPLGSALVEDEKLNSTGLRSFEPDFGREGSDGRRIYVRWTFEKPTLGQTINVSAIYEILSGVDQFTVFAVILTAIVVSFLAALVFIFRKHSVRDILPVLTEGERKAMEILLREKGEVDQRVIVKETDFSKAKVSRIISDLMDRGLVEKVAKGRKNLIKLKKHVKTPEKKSGK